jgi:hypothetical protein
MGFLILAIFSLGLILSLMTGIINPAPITCFVYKAFSAANPDIEAPLYCREESCSVYRETIKETGTETVSAYLAAYAVACYTSKKSPCPKTGSSAVCYEIHVPGGLHADETDVTRIMERDYESGCLLLPNSKVVTASGLEDYRGSCGTEDRLDWQLGGDETLILVEYDTEAGKVVMR